MTAWITSTTLVKQIQQESMEPTERETTSGPQRTKEESFKLFRDQFLKDLGKDELRQDLDQFKMGIEDYLFSKWVAYRLPDSLTGNLFDKN